MLLALDRLGFVRLEPQPPKPQSAADAAPKAAPEPAPRAWLQVAGVEPSMPTRRAEPLPETPRYTALRALPEPGLATLLLFRSVHPLYAAFLLTHLGLADAFERLQALESVLGMPTPILKYVRVPPPESLPPGPLATTRLDQELLRRGLIAAPRNPDEPEDDDDGWSDEPGAWERPPTLAEKLRLLFDATHPGITDVRTQSVWAAGELLHCGGDFNEYVKTHDLVKQEGLVFRHLLRLILLAGEFASAAACDVAPEAWRADMEALARRLTVVCRQVDPASTDEAIAQARAADPVAGES
jgi:hypothetical protein